MKRLKLKKKFRSCALYQGHANHVVIYPRATQSASCSYN